MHGLVSRQVAGEQHFSPLNRDLNLRIFIFLTASGPLRSNFVFFFRFAMQQHLEGSQLRELCQIHGMTVDIKKSQLIEIWKNT